MATISGTEGNDTLTGTDDADTISGLGGNDIISGGGGSDLLYGGGGSDTVTGDGGDDTVYGGTENDWLYGGEGDDSLVGGSGSDNIYGGSGNDTLEVSGDNENLYGGDDADTFIIGGPTSSGIYNVSIYGESGGVDDDKLDLSYLHGLGFKVTNDVRNPETNGNPGFDGQISLSNPATGATVNINYHDIESVICFTPGTEITTPLGLRPVEELRQGDLVLTRDSGLQEVCWIGRKTLTGATLISHPSLQPVVIKAGSLGDGVPERDLVVSPNHRMLITSEKSQLYFGEREVLIASKHLVGCRGIARAHAGGITYIHILFRRHEIILANGAWSESFQPGTHSISGLDRDQRNELFWMFPELMSISKWVSYPAARLSLKRHEAKLLTATEGRKITD